MKKLFTLLLTVGALSFANAQTTEIPQSGVNLTVEQPKVVLEKGINYEFDLHVVRSRRARKANFDTPRIVGPKGIEFDIKAASDQPDLYKVVVNAENMEPGKYFYLVSSKSTSMHKAKSLSMSFEVTEAGSVASN